jgi:hypothetical protein
VVAAVTNNDQQAWAVLHILVAQVLQGIRKAAILHTIIKDILLQEQAALVDILAATAAPTAGQELSSYMNITNR